MNTPTQFKAIYVVSIAIGLSPNSLAIGQTFSPYTPAQIQEFNSQPIAPVETPAGPVYLENMPAKQQPRPSIDSRYIKNPDGEEQAEAQGAGSAAPFEPIPATISF
ncbi:hypothetical protein [Polynucleobacter arcticus]|uniref:Uncharacterized protein n=1 Tax=Polynucleobacter arcticus TaxID=1743165 RepID=A0A6M9PQV8_9BURK|nr:hypothetical protein [Polynucleobacter arcticus]QKM60226.1 hypothetical protein DN92_03730 [Polynucleobacter arcticus]